MLTESAAALWRDRVQVRVRVQNADIRMTDASGKELDKHLMGLRSGDGDLLANGQSRASNEPPSNHRHLEDLEREA